MRAAVHTRYGPPQMAHTRKPTQAPPAVESAQGPIVISLAADSFHGRLIFGRFRPKCAQPMFVTCFATEDYSSRYI